MSNSQQDTIAGFAGEGVMMICQLLAYLGNETGYQSLWFPSYGPETRGGTANCAITISKEVIYSPVFAKATCVIALNKPSLLKFQDKVQAGGVLLYNSSLIQEEVTHPNARVYAIPMQEIATQLGNPKVANMVMLGAYLALISQFDLATIDSVLTKFLPTDKQHLLEVNQAAIRAGMDFIENNKNT